MAEKAKNRSLYAAKNSKQDEFYTQLSDIEKELKHYKKHFKGKVVYCNCDDPRMSNFFHYFSYNFERLGLKKLITTCYKSQDMDLFSHNDSEQAVYLEYYGDKNGNNMPDLEEIGIKPMKGDGDFRSEESIELLKQADIVVTNPPFSLFRQYVSQLVEHDKQFIIVGSQNAITYKEVFPLIKENKIWLGYNNGDMAFKVPDYFEPRDTRYWQDENGQKWRSLGNACWFTNLDISKRHEDLILYKTYNPEEYPSYDNYDAIEANKTKDIPVDYEGVMGVPLTFLDKHNPDQFEIVGVTQSWADGRIKTYPPQIQVGADGSKSNVTKLNDGAALKQDTPPHGVTHYMVENNLLCQSLCANPYPKENLVKIEFKEITVRELTNDYEDKDEAGVVGYGGKLDIRPPYQREFIYKDKQRDAVIDTITKDFPLNVMYWAVREDGNLEVIDGQQRTISICQFVEGDFAFAGRYFHNLQTDEKDQILGYKLMVYLCSGTDSEKLQWFKTINIAGERLTDEELRNALYAGSWVSDAKRHFSKTSCPAYGLGSDYLNGSPIRQEYLETVIYWFSEGNIEGYMAKQQHKPNANELWLYFQSVINWIKATFPKYRREIKGIAWGELYNAFKGQEFDSKVLEAEIARLMEDEDVTNKKGIYSYILDGKEKHLNIRAFSNNQKREAYERQKGICPVCKKHFEIDGMEGDHITPWHEGGKTAAQNCQMLCKDDNRRKSGK